MISSLAYAVSLIMGAHVFPPDGAVTLQEAMMGCPMRGINRDAHSLREHECNMQALMDFLGLDLIGIQLSHIQGKYPSDFDDRHHCKWS